MQKTVVFNLDDFGIGNAIDNLLIIKEHIPTFRCTMFTIPMNVSVLTGDLGLEKLEEWAKIISEYDWIEIALHGFAHQDHEGGKADTREKAEVLVKASENMANRIGLKPVKVWKSPFWVSSDALYEYLTEMDYIVAVDKNQPIPQTKGMKKYIHNWSIDTPAPATDVIKAHGHCYGTNNDINTCIGNFMREVPADAEYLTISEYYKKYGEQPSIHG